MVVTVLEAYVATNRAADLQAAYAEAAGGAVPARTAPKHLVARLERFNKVAH